MKKKSDGFRPVINLKNLNQFIHTEHFTTITNLRTMLSKDDWIVTIDISDANLTIPLDEEFKDYVAFQCQDQTYRFLCKSSRLQGFSIFRRLDSCCPNKALCLKQSQFSVNFLQKLGFTINFEKSSLAPSQIKEWLGFVINSRSTTQRKIDILIGKAQDLKNKMGVSLREISQFLGLCNSSKPAILQAPLHYRSIQRLLIRNLKRFLNPYQSLLNCSYSINSRPGLVDSGNEVQLFKKNLYSPAKCSHFYRLQRFRMGCHSKSGQNSRPMELKSAGLAHQ